MKKFYLFPLLWFMFFIANGQEVVITKNNHELISVNKVGQHVNLIYSPVKYLFKDVAIYKANKLTLTQNEYSRLLTELFSSFENKKDKEIVLGDQKIVLDYENIFYVFSKSKLGLKLLKREKQVRFSTNGEDYSMYLTKEDLEKLNV